MAIRNNPRKAELKAARRQRRQLQRMLENLQKMSSEWERLSSWLETESGRLAEGIDQHLKALDEQIDEWSNGTDNGE